MGGCTSLHSSSVASNCTRKTGSRGKTHRRNTPSRVTFKVSRILLISFSPAPLHTITGTCSLFSTLYLSSSSNNSLLRSKLFYSSPLLRNSSYRFKCKYFHHRVEQYSHLLQLQSNRTQAVSSNRPRPRLSSACRS